MNEAFLPTGQSPVRKRRVTALAAAVLTGVAIVATMAVVGVAPASAATLNAVATTANSNTDAYLPSGASTTPFTVTLPPSASCSGDTASDGYHVYSYVVKKGTALSGVTFIQTPSQGFGFVNNIGTYYGPANTAATTGQVISIPNNFQWAPLVSDDGVPLSQVLYTGGTSGVWEAGLACANSSHALTDNWNTEITFTASSSDPTGFAWSAVPGPSGDKVPAFTSASSAAFTEGSTNTFTPTATGTPAPTITESGALPSGVSFTGGALTGTPTVTGSFPITFTATNGIGNPATQSFTLTVSAAVGFHVTTTTLPSATPGVAYSTTLQASGGTTPYAWKKVGTPPKGLKLRKTGVLSGTPSAKKVTAGNYSIQVKVNDAGKKTAKKTATATLTLHVT
jgi:hypothetical protein